MDIAYGIIIHFTQYLQQIARNRYNQPDVPRLARDIWKNIDVEERELILTSFDPDDSEDDILNNQPENLMLQMPYPSVGELEVVLLTRSSTHVFIGLVQRYDVVPINMQPTFSKEQMQQVDYILTNNNFNQTEPQVYITNSIEWAGPGNVDELEALP